MMAAAVDVVVMAENGDIEGVRAWIRAHQFYEDVVSKLNQALIAAVRRCQAGVVELLLMDGQASADVRDEENWVSAVNMTCCDPAITFLQSIRITRQFLCWRRKKVI